MNHERALYEFAADVHVVDLPPGTVESVNSTVLDHLGCAVQGSSLPWIRGVLSALETAGAMRVGSPGRAAHAVGWQHLLEPVDAALVNGASAHGFDFDDTHLPTMTHPGSVVIPAVIAAAEAEGSDGRDVVASVVVGYEVMARICRMIGLGFGERGFHATGQVGPMGAAAAVARLYGLGPDDVAGAVGLAASFGGGIKSFTDGHGTVKRLHAGRAAQSGLLAASLQRSGVAGPQHALTGRFGVATAYSTDDDPDPRVLSAGLGGDFAIDEVYLKQFAACGAVHGAMAAAAAIGDVPGDQIERIVVGTSVRALRQNSIPEPLDVMAAQYSTEYAVAVALAGRSGDAQPFLDAGTPSGRPFQEIAGRVRLTTDESAEAAYPDINQAWVEVHLADGTVRTAEGSVTAATSRGWTVAERKFLAVTDGLLDRVSAAEVVGAVLGLSSGGAARECMSPLRALVATDSLGTDPSRGNQLPEHPIPANRHAQRGTEER